MCPGGVCIPELACLDDAEQVSLSMGLKPLAMVDAARDGGYLGHVPADAGPGTVWHRVAASGNVWHSVATVGNPWQRDGRTG